MSISRLHFLGLVLAPTLLASSVYSGIMLANYPTPANEHLRNAEIAGMLGYANASDVIFGMRGVKHQLKFIKILFILNK
jgi:hypothetical protein